jgi:hypothetical protein
MEAGLISDGGTGVFVGWADFRDTPFDGFTPTANLYVQKVTAAGIPQWTADGVLALPDVSFDGGIGVSADGAGGVIFAWSQGYPGDIYSQRLDASGTPQWTSPGVLVCGDADEQYYPVVTTDGSGGAFVVWIDERGTDEETYAQHLDASGVSQWTADGQSLTGGNLGLGAGICPDGAGGLLAFWHDDSDVIGQRFNSAGAEQWTPGGESVGTGSAFLEEIQALADGAGGAYIVWRDPQANTNVYAQRVNSAGTAQWTSGGVTVCSAAGDRFVEDGYVEAGGGVTLLWEDSRSGMGVDLYAQKLNGAGVLQWPANGVQLCSSVEREQGFLISTDGSGGAVAAWISYDRVDPEPRMQHVNAAGTPQFGANGTLVVADPGVQRSAVTVPDGGGGEWIVWHERQLGVYQLRAKRLDVNGNPLTGTIVVCPASGAQYLGGAVPDGAGGIVLGWEDERSGTDTDLYAQHIGAGGALQWTGTGVVVCNAGFDQTGLRMVSDGAGSAIFTWQDERIAPMNVYAQRLNAAGVPLWPPNGLAVSTLPGFKFGPVIVPAGSNGAVVLWSSAGIYGQMLDGAGAAQWTSTGMLLESSSTGFTLTCRGAVSDQNDGAVVLYERPDLDIFTGEFFNIELRALHTSNTGVSTWTADGVLLATGNAFRERAELVTDGNGGAIAAWSDARSGIHDIYAQRVDNGGTLQWSAAGRGVCTSPSWQWLTSLHEDGLGGAVMAWTDELNGFADVYAQRVDANGVSQWSAGGEPIASAARGQYEAGLHVAGGSTILAWTDFRNGSERLIYSQKLNLSGTALWTTDGVTSALFSTVAAEAGVGRVRVTWEVGASVPTVNAYRRPEGETEWMSMGALVVDGMGYVVLEDEAVVAGTRYVYRIGILVDGHEVFSDDVWIEVPNTLVLAIEHVAPQPARRDVWVTFTLPALAPARLAVLDVAGRRVGSRELLGLAPGRHVLRLDEVPKEAGVYYVRVWQGGESAGGRVVRVN